jgi:elongation factor P
MNITDLKKGTVFLELESPWKVLDYKHTTLGRGSATIRIKAKNLENGKIRDFTYNSGAKVEDADVEVVKCDFLYRDSTSAHFSGDVVLPIADYEEKMAYLTKGTEVGILLFEEDPIDLMIPITVELKIKSTSDAIKGNTVTNAYKEAIMETGLRIQVPMFAREGDIIKINTESGNYITRV